MRVVVVGGGLAGLTAALDLADRGASVSVLEASERFGGQIRSLRTGGFLIEHGAEGFVARSQAVPALCRRLGLAEQLVAQSRNRTVVAEGARLEELPPGEAARLLGIQVGPEDLGNGLTSLRGGMGDLIDALVRALERRAALRPHAAAVALERAGSGFRVRLEAAPPCSADALVLATPPPVAGRLLSGLAAGPLPDLDLHFDSLVSVSLALGSDQIACPEELSGILFRGDAWRGLRACTVASAKFPHRSVAAHRLIRAFFRPERGAADRSDRAWAALAWELLAPPLGLIGSPGESWVARWPDAIPRFGPGHRAGVAEWRGIAARLGPIALAGAGFDPTGVDAAVGSAARAAQLLLDRPRERAARFAGG